MFESARPLEEGAFRFTLRTSGLRRPLTLRLPSPAPEGTSAGLVEGVVLSELSASVGLGDSWDVGFGFGVHLHQSALDEERGDSIVAHSLRGRDPRLGVGWSRNLGPWSLRPFAQVHVPLGDAGSFAGERKARALAGIASAFDAKVLSWSTQISFLYREAQAISATTWGPQLFLGTGAFVPVHEKLELGLQMFAAPVLSPQKDKRGAQVIPGELLVGGRYKVAGVSLGFGAGFGLPLSRTSGVHAEQKAIRGPTSPTYRGFLDFTYEAESPTNTRPKTP